MFNTDGGIKDPLSSDNSQSKQPYGLGAAFEQPDHAIQDGSTNTEYTVASATGLLDEATPKRTGTGASVVRTGEIVSSLAKDKNLDLNARSIEILGDCGRWSIPADREQTGAMSTFAEIAHLTIRYEHLCRYSASATPWLGS